MAEGKKQRKVDRNRKRGGQNNAYKAEHRHEKSHARRIRAHLARYGANDRVAQNALKLYEVWR